MDVDRRFLMGLGAAGVSLAAGAARAAPPAGPLADIDAYAQAHMAAHSLPGMTLAVVRPGAAASVMHYGYANLDRRMPIGDNQLFQIGSISKSFTALCIFRLMEAGRLSLDDEVRRHLPEVPLPSGGRITIQSLLNHSSGLPDDAPMFPRGGDQRLWQGFAVGAQWSYSNLGFGLLGQIVERVDGRPFRDALKALVLDPLGMAATRPAIVTGERALYVDGYSPLYSDRGYPRGGPLAPGAWTDQVTGAGCVASTAADMAKYMRFLIAAGQGHGAPLLTDANAKRFCTATMAAPGWGAPGDQYANGLAVVPVNGRALLHHTGGMLMFSSSLHVDPVAGVACFASVNVGSTGYRPRALTGWACTRLRAEVEGVAASAPPPAAAPAPDAGDLHGRYVAKGGETLEIGPNVRGVTATLAGRAMPMEMGAPDAFRALEPAAAAHPLVFKRDGKTPVRAWWGQVEFVRLAGGQPAAAFSPAPPPALGALIGHYINDDPWRGGFQVTVQGAALMLDGITPAVPLPGGGFRVGDKDWSPERLAFDAPIAGRPQRATVSGVDYQRRVT